MPPPQSEAALLLELKDVSKAFGGLVAVANLFLSTREGTIHGLIGPNGAGKSTVFDLISGAAGLSSGEITFCGRRVSGLRRPEICRLGIARTFQATSLFTEFTAFENVLVACRGYAAAGLVSSSFLPEPWRRKDREALVRAESVLAAVGLESEARRPAGQLPHRDQKTLSVAMALATEPKLVLLDEPMAGLTAEEADRMGTLLRTLPPQGTTVVLVEHDMRIVMGLCDIITVLDHGIRIAEGSPDVIRQDARVIEAYLGAEQEHAGGR